VTEIGRIGVVMYVSDQVIYGKLQLTDYRDPSSILGFWVVIEKLKRKKSNLKTPKNRGKRSSAPWRMEIQRK